MVVAVIILKLLQQRHGITLLLLKKKKTIASPYDLSEEENLWLGLVVMELIHDGYDYDCCSFYFLWASHPHPHPISSASPSFPFWIMDPHFFLVVNLKVANNHIISPLHFTLHLHCFNWLAMAYGDQFDDRNRTAKRVT